MREEKVEEQINAGSDLERTHLRSTLRPHLNLTFTRLAIPVLFVLEQETRIGISSLLPEFVSSAQDFVGGNEKAMDRIWPKSADPGSGHNCDSANARSNWKVFISAIFVEGRSKRFCCWTR
jgi:hypothetical protein